MAMTMARTIIPATPGDNDNAADAWDKVRAQLFDMWRSLVRTIVPIVAGAVASFAVRHGLQVKEAEVGLWLTPVLQGAWYSVPRLLEPRFPQLGWLLGLAKQPAYSPTPVISAPEPAPEVVEEVEAPEPDIAVMADPAPGRHDFAARYDAKCAICDKTRRAKVHETEGADA